MNIGLILASGSGTRMGNISKPKQFLEVNDKPILIYTLETFQKTPCIDYIVVVTNKDYISYVEKLVKDYEISKVKLVSEGGDSRQKSSYNGILALASLNVKSNDNIIIHDAARPLVSQKIIEENVKKCDEFSATDTVIPASDTIIKSVDKTTIENIPNRSEIYHGQTPQSFKYEIIKNAHELAIKNNDNSVTDDCGLVMKMGVKVALVEGSKLNIKITTLDDLDLFKLFLEKQK